MALSGYLLVQPAQLSAQAAVVEQKINALVHEFSDMEQLMKGTTSYWGGEAGDFHREQYLSYKNYIEEMIRRYREHVADLRQMAGVYDTAERVAVTAADSLPPSFLD